MQRGVHVRRERDGVAAVTMMTVDLCRDGRPHVWTSDGWRLLVEGPDLQAFSRSQICTRCFAELTQRIVVPETPHGNLCRCRDGNFCPGWIENTIME